jgi:hypothetical protein
MKKLNQIGPILLMATIIGATSARAQDSFSSLNLSALTDNGVLVLSGTNVSSFKSFSDDELTALVDVLDATPTVSTPTLSNGNMMPGTFWSLQNPGTPPLPSDTIGVDVWPMADGSFLLDDLDFNYSGISAGPLGMHAMDDGSPLVPGGGTNDYTPTNSYVLPDYGTNLWIAQTAAASNYLFGIGSNTVADIVYTIQSLTNLLQAPAGWRYEGTIVGSELTNWTPLSVAQNNRTNLFIRLRSEESSDGSGLPNWWELEYFGTNGVDPNGDPMGDGWSNIQKFQNGWNPNVFYTPPAPQGVTATLELSNQTATVTWLPSSGNVTGYTVQKTDTYPDPVSVQTFTVAASATNFTDNISTNNESVLYAYYGYSYGVSYRVQALYSAGNSGWSASVPLQQLTVSGSINPGPDGTYLAATRIPDNAATVQLIYVDQGADIFHDDESFDHIYTIPVSSFTNGFAKLADSWKPASTDGYGGVGYTLYVRTVDANGNPSKSMLLTSTEYYWISTYIWGLPFYDGRQQLKQNLIFQLRAASTAAPFAFATFTNDSSDYRGLLDYVISPTNYVYSGLYDVNNENGIYGWSYDFALMNVYRPFEDNALSRNFASASVDEDANGYPNTGVQYVGNFDNFYNLSLEIPSVYQPTTNVSGSVPLLDTTTARWLCTYPLDLANVYPDYDPVSGEYVYLDGISISFVGDTQYNNLQSGLKNYWGLPITSAKIFYTPDGSSIYNTVLNAGDSIANVGLNTAYMETAPPQFQTVEYDFWQSAYYGTNIPGCSYFSTNRKSDLVIVGVGQGIQMAAYAKLAVTNGNPGTYAYLGQYLDKAYEIDDSGNVTTNLTGEVSPYGGYFATDAGRAALVTMPDVDTGERGTCMVYSVSLQLDKNHDGNMDLSFNGPDATLGSSPYVFWCNNNYDRSLWDADDQTYYDDDLGPADVAKLNLNQQVPDCDYENASGERVIPDERDLEDYARLWICGVTTNLLAALPSGSTVTLSWGDESSPNSNNPTIDLFQAVDPDGGMEYLTNSTTTQYENPTSYVGRLGPGQSIQLNSSYFSGWAGNHFIWCGVNHGTGGLNLTIADATGNVLAQTTAYIQTVDIKQMYERWTVGDSSGDLPTTNAILASNDLTNNGIMTPFEYTAPPNTNTLYILLVHGWNDEIWIKDRFAETALKRLYWQGYQGRFGSFRWPTDYDFNGTLIDAILQPHNYDGSENTAWNSAAGLLNKLIDLNAKYPGHVYMLAHSMGNVVAGEALRLAAQNGDGQIVNTYVASQAAIPAHVYDASVTSPYLINYTHSSHGIPAPGAPKTPNIYVNRMTNNAAAVGRKINYYNVNDYALSADSWCFDQALKPDTFANGLYTYIGSTNDSAPWNNFEFAPYAGSLLPLDIVNNLTERYEVLAYAANPYSTAYGATPGITNVINVNLANPSGSIWPPDSTGNNYTEHFWHSAQFRGDCWQEWNYWNTLLFSASFGFNVNNP